MSLSQLGRERDSRLRNYRSASHEPSVCGLYPYRAVPVLPAMLPMTSINSNARCDSRKALYDVQLLH